MMLFWFCSLTSCIFPLASLVSAQTVILTSSVEQNGRQAACPREVVTFTCMVTEAGGLQWTAEPYVSQSDSVAFSGISSEGETRDPTAHIHIVLDDVSPASDPRLRNFNSTLTVSDSIALNGTVIQCISGSHIGMRTLISGTPPFSPQNPTTTSNLEYSLSNFTVTVQWESPASDGGVDIDSYTLTGAGITVPLTVLSNEPLMATLTLSYNEIHMVSITASNCAGESTASVVTIHEVGCGPPTHPSRGSLGDLTSSQEGAVVTFQCSPGLVPSQQTMSVCMANGSWIPDPAELVCGADCRAPSPPVNGFVMPYDSTLEGSQIVFQCSSGFVPSQQILSVCTANGRWTPDPAELVCRADCGIPVIVNGSVNYTTTVEGSTATYQCDTGLIPVGVMTAMCVENQEWVPDPADAGCRLPADCGVPVIANGSVDYTTTVEGSTATYQCDTGLIPEGVMTAMCIENGEWAPDPAGVGCRLPGQATCGVPPSPTSGSVDFTNAIEGSEAMFRCDSCPEMTAVCTTSGEWVPNPGDLSCGTDRPSSTLTGLSTAEAVGITFVLSSIVSFTAGLLVALVIAYCYIRRQQKTSQYSPSEPKQPAPMYEDVSMDVRRDIDLKENVAYRVVGQ